MKYYSTENRAIGKTLREAVLQGLSSDSGLFMPGQFPVFPESRIRAMKDKSFREISGEIAQALFSDDLPADDIDRIVNESITFDIPLVPVTPKIGSLELFHGPTLAFKDVGARFMARMMGYFTRDLDHEINVLVATSGDTGSAVASGFWNVRGIRVFILYPSGLVSPLQEKQFTTLGSNITALEILGSFDDCQHLVKTAFLDRELSSRMVLTSANSINLARLLPQTFYYFHGYARSGASAAPVISVPSGNFGNLTAGLIAGRMGLPVRKFLAATNINDIVPAYLETGVYAPRPSVPTIANAMDVGNPSNFARILDLFGHSRESMNRDITGYRYNDEQLKRTIRQVYEQYGYILEPHGAAGFQALSDHLLRDPDADGFFMETAHPAKFLETVRGILDFQPEIPERLRIALSKEKVSVRLSAGYDELREYLLSV